MKFFSSKFSSNSSHLGGLLVGVEWCAETVCASILRAKETDFLFLMGTHMYE